MAPRPKYKLDQFVKTAETEENAAVTGVIEAVTLRKDGVSYALTGVEDEISEGEIEAVYRPVTPRKSKPRAEKKEKAAGKKAA